MLKVEDYFNNDHYYRLTAKEREKANWIRDKINSFQDLSQAAKWLDYRRRAGFTNEDYKFFGIPLSERFEKRELEKYEKNYSYDSTKASYVSGYSPYSQMELHKMDQGYDPEDRAENPSTKNPLRRKYSFGDMSPAEAKMKLEQMPGVFNSNNVFGQASNAITKKLATASAAVIKWVAIVMAIIMAIICLTIYGYGVTNSTGKSPFPLCEAIGTASFSSSGSSLNPSNLELVEGDANYTIAAPTNFAGFTMKEVSIANLMARAKSAGWTDNAVIGIGMYSLQEGSALGTFSYEGYYGVVGPNGKKPDTKTTDMTTWQNYGKTDPYKSFIIKNTSAYSSSRWAIGLGMFQMSDVYNGGSMEAKNATALMQYAQDKGVAWQDVKAQIDYYFEVRYFSPEQITISTDSNQSAAADPTKDSLTARDWARRFYAGIGMPGYAASSVSDSDPHLSKEHETTATKMLEKLNSGEYDKVIVVDSATQKKGDCEKLGTAGIGNNSIATAAVSLALYWRPLGGEDKCIGSDSNDPLKGCENRETFTTVFPQVYSGDIYYRSCDRATGTAVRWSGADDEFPVGPTGTQYNYLRGSDKWKLVASGLTGNDLSLENLKALGAQPGDVFITEGDGHIATFVGNEAVKARFPDAPDDVVMFQASNEGATSKPPRLTTDNSWESRIISIYRNVAPEKNSQYSGIQAP